MSKSSIYSVNETRKIGYLLVFYMSCIKFVQMNKKQKFDIFFIIKKSINLQNAQNTVTNKKLILI